MDFLSPRRQSMEDYKAVKDQAIVARQVAVNDLRDPKLADLLSYWAARRHGRSLPLRRDLLPEDMGALLGRIALIEVEPAHGDFRFRLVGTRLRSVLGADLTGQSLQRLTPPHLEALLRNYCRAAIAEQVPQCVQVTARRDRRSFTYLVLMLPLSQTGQAADRLLLAFNWGPGEVPLIDPLDRGPI